jgi:hypothetical protein
MVSTISFVAQALLVEVAPISSDSEINGYGVSVTALTFAFLADDGSIVHWSSEESAFHFFCRRVAAFLPGMAIISPFQILYQWLGCLNRRQSFFSLGFSHSEPSIPFKVSSLLWDVHFGSSLSLDLEISPNWVIFCPLP